VLVVGDDLRGEVLLQCPDELLRLLPRGGDDVDPFAVQIGLLLVLL
jgi:hypothetical protein